MIHDRLEAVLVSSDANATKWVLKQVVVGPDHANLLTLQQKWSQFVLIKILEWPFESQNNHFKKNLKNDNSLRCRFYHVKWASKGQKPPFWNVYP